MSLTIQQDVGTSAPEPWSPVVSRTSTPREARADEASIGAAAGESLQEVVDALPGTVRGCSCASASIPGGPLLITVGSDARARASDQWQHALHEGPALHAVRTGHSVLSHDLRDETRWPHWCRQVTDALDLEAALSIVLRCDGRSFGALNLYSAEPAGLSTPNLARLHLLGIRLAAGLFEVRLAGVPAVLLGGCAAPARRRSSARRSTSSAGPS